MLKRILLLFSFYFLVNPVFAGQSKDFKVVDSLIESFSLKAALQMLNAMEQKSPNSFEINSRKGAIYLGLGRYKNAIEAYTICSRIRPGDAFIYEILGNLNAQINNNKAAIFNFNKAYISSTDVEHKLLCKFEILNLMLNTRRLEGFMSHIEDAKRLSADNFDVHFIEGRYYNEVEDYAKALQILEKLIPEVPNVRGNERYFYEYGLALHRLKRYEEATQAFANANHGQYRNKIKSFSSTYYINTAKAYKEIYDYDKATYFLDIAGKLGNEHEIETLRNEIAGLTKNKSETIHRLEVEIKNAEPGEAMIFQKSELALLKFQAGDYVDVNLLCDDLLAVNIKNINAIFLKVISTYKNGDYSPIDVETISKLAFNKKISIEKRHVFAFAAGVIYYEFDEDNLAKRMFKYSNVGVFKQPSRRFLSQLYKKQHYGENWKGKDYEY